MAIQVTQEQMTKILSNCKNETFCDSFEEKETEE